MKERIRKHLLSWYKDHKRALPWRKTSDPYRIWLSEIILQQTRVEQGLPYYQKFVDHYPQVSDLASAPEDQVLKDWEGLGYYSRARNLHHAAKTIHKEYAGEFPRTYSGIRNLKGVGDYTAAAVASFAFDLPHAVLDGNVFRVLSRLFEVDTPINSTAGKKRFQALANDLLNPENPAEHNQAMMEFGALQCKPQRPDCANCPLQMDCLAYQNNRVAELPQKDKKLKVKERYLNYFLVQDAKQVIIEKRTQGIWKGLFQFPLYESQELWQFEKASEILKELGLPLIVAGQERRFTLKPHRLSHQLLHISIWQINFSELPPAPGLKAVKLNQLKDLAFPKPLRAFLDEKQLTLPLA